MQDLLSLKDIGFPVWILVIVMLVNVFKAPLSLIIPESVRAWVQSRTLSHKASLELQEDVMDGKLRAIADISMRQGRLEQSLIELLHKKEDYQQRLFTDLSEAIHTQTSELSAIKNIGQSTHELLSCLLDKYVEGGN